MGSIRELLAFGTIAGVQVLTVKLLPMAQHSFGGFLLIGLISAVWNNAINIYKDRLEKEVAAYESGI